MKILVCAIVSGFHKSGYVMDMLNLINHVPWCSIHSCVCILLKEVNACFECQERRKAPRSGGGTEANRVDLNSIRLNFFGDILKPVGALAPQFLHLCWVHHCKYICWWSTKKFAIHLAIYLLSNKHRTTKACIYSNLCTMRNNFRSFSKVYGY